MKKTVFKSMKKILIVEDCPDLRELVVDKLKQSFEGRIDCACDGKQALQMLQEGSYDLCYTDHRMPHKTGGELILEAQLMGIKTPFIMFSGTPPKIKSPNLLEIVEKPNVGKLKTPMEALLDKAS